MQHLIRGIRQVWSQIGPDVEQAMEAFGGELDNQQRIEACIDADRLDPRMGFLESGEALQEWQALRKLRGTHHAIQMLAEHPDLQF